MTKTLLVAAGAAIGGVARYFITGVAHQVLGASFPYGTLAVNVVGCFLVGAFMTAAESRMATLPEARIFVVVGILGGLTTFSALGYETHSLLRDRETALSFVNILANVGLGVGAVAAGRAAILALGL